MDVAVNLVHFRPQVAAVPDVPENVCGASCHPLEFGVAVLNMGQCCRIGGLLLKAELTQREKAVRQFMTQGPQHKNWVFVLHRV